MAFNQKKPAVFVLARVSLLLCQCRDNLVGVKKNIQIETTLENLSKQTLRRGGAGLLFVCLFHQLLKFFLLIMYLSALLTIQMLNYLTNTFHVYVSLLSNRSQTTSKCYKNKRVAHEAIAECVTT